MKNNFNKSLSTKKTILILSVIAVVMGAVCGILGEITLPLLIGFLSCIYLFDYTAKHLYSIVVSLIIALLNVGAILADISISFFSISAIIISLVISFAFKGGKSKADTAYICTLICTIFTALGALVLGMAEQGVFTIEAGIGFYSSLFESYKSLFVDSFLEVYTTAGVEVSRELIEQVYDQQISLIISYLLIGGFAVTGISMKIFGAVTKYCSEDKGVISGWSFASNGVYAYFYVILALCAVFTSTPGSLFTISVLNLYNLFMVVFAYLGFKYSFEALCGKMKPFAAFCVLVAILLVFIAFSVQIFAFIGAVRTVKRRDYNEPKAV